MDEKDLLENVRAKYQIAINKNTSESEILWNRYSAMLIINTILASIIGINKESILSSNQIIPFVSLIGLTSCVLWLFMTWKGFHWIHFWILQANILEGQLRDLDDINPVIEGDKERKKFCKFCKTEYASYLLILLISSIYFYVLFIMRGMSPLLFISYGIFCFIIGFLVDRIFLRLSL